MLKQKLEKELKEKLSNKIILITGGAGSLGTSLSEKILHYPINTLRILDINEHSLFTLNRKLNDKRVRPLLGNILDEDRLKMACKGVDIIIHTAAIKNIEISEFNPIETIDVNINGTVNLIKTVIELKPKIFLNISTDKAADASTLYGSTKQLGERLTSWAGSHINSTKFASVRLGNIMNSKGNVFEVWNEEIKNKKPLSITHPNMERFFFTNEEAVNFIFRCLLLSKNGEIYVPKMSSYKIIDLAKKISKKHKVIGLRPGEKMKEILISTDEIKQAKSKSDMWIISPVTG